jgi:zinc D-Ala-D-Ala carboxypeptidase
MSIPLSPHFTLSELTVTRQTDTAGNPLANCPDASELHYLRSLCVSVLEPIRELWGCPVTVTSGFRSYDVEMRVSGKDYGQHRRGQAADIVPSPGSRLSIVDAFEAIWRSAIPYDQLLLEQKGSVKWIHVSCAADGDSPRRQALWSPDNGRSWAFYFAGITNQSPEVA